MKKLILASLVVAASSVAFGSTTVVITFTSLPATTGNGTTNTQASTYNGVSTATVAGIPNVQLICDDFNQTTSFPSSPLDYSENTIAALPETAGISGDVDFGSGTIPVTGSISQTQAYDTAAVLAYEIEAVPATAGNAQTIADYQYALWYLMEPTGVDGAIKDYPLDTAASNDLVAAYKDVQGTGTLSSTQVAKLENDLIIYTPTSANPSNQEFIGLTPEPSSWFLMMAAGLLLCLPRVRSRLRVTLSSK